MFNQNSNDLVKQASQQTGRIQNSLETKNQILQNGNGNGTGTGNRNGNMPDVTSANIVNSQSNNSPDNSSSQFTGIIQNILNYTNPAEKVIEDQLTSYLRISAQKMLQLAIENEVESFIKIHKTSCLSGGQRSIVRNGYLPERQVQTGIGSIEVKVPRVRDRSNSGIKFTSNFICIFI